MKDKRTILRKTAIILFWLLLWHLLAFGVDNHILLATPWETLQRLWELSLSGEFWLTIAGSLLRIGIGFLFGTAAGLLFAVLSSHMPLFEELLRPLIILSKTIPVASFVVILLIWWGSENLAISICFLIVLPNIYLGTLEGIRNTDPKLLEMAKVMAIPLSTRFFYIYRPALRPFLSSSLRLALGMCWKSGVAAEVIGTPTRSIGEQLYFSKIHLDTAGVFAWTAVIILLSIGFEKLILWGIRCFFVWEPKCSPAGSISQRATFSVFEHSRKKITVDQVSKSFGPLQVFENFSATYEPGEIYYLTEPSGSGKTTLFRMLAGLEIPDSGEIYLTDSYNRYQLGAHLQEEAAAFRKGIFSIVFQEDRLCEEYSAVRNVEMITGSREKAEAALKKLLEPEALYKPCRQLSGGMKRRVALVRAMEAVGSYVLLDEPFTGMDAATKKRAECYILEKQQGRTLVIATHI